MRNGSNSFNWHPGAPNFNGQASFVQGNANVSGWVTSASAQAAPAGLSRKVGPALPSPHSDDAQDWLEWASLHA